MTGLPPLKKVLFPLNFHVEIFTESVIRRTDEKAYGWMDRQMGGIPASILRKSTSARQPVRRTDAMDRQMGNTDGRHINFLSLC